MVYSFLSLILGIVLAHTAGYRATSSHRGQMYGLCLYYVTILMVFETVFAAGKMTGSLSEKGWSTSIDGIVLHGSVDWLSEISVAIKVFVVFNAIFFSSMLMLFFIAGLTNSLPGDREDASINSRVSNVGSTIYWWVSVFYAKAQASYSAFILSWQVFIRVVHWHFAKPVLGTLAAFGISLSFFSVAIIGLRLAYGLTHPSTGIRLLSSKLFRLIWLPSHVHIRLLKWWRVSDMRKRLSKLR